MGAWLPPPRIVMKQFNRKMNHEMGRVEWNQALKMLCIGKGPSDYFDIFWGVQSLLKVHHGLKKKNFCSICPKFGLSF